MQPLGSDHFIIIPYQELLGNYDFAGVITAYVIIIPYQELLGNYDDILFLQKRDHNYTIPRAIREL